MEIISQNVTSPLTETFSCALPVFGIVLLVFVQLHCLDSGHRHPRRKTRMTVASRPVEVAPKTATKSTKRIVPNAVQSGTFRLPWQIFPWFFSVASRIPGYDEWCKDGARPALPIRHVGLTNVPAHRHVLGAATMPLWVQIPESLKTKVCFPQECI